MKETKGTCLEQRLGRLRWKLVNLLIRVAGVKFEAFARFKWVTLANLG